MGLQDIFSEWGKASIWTIIAATHALVMAFTWLIVADGRDNLGALSTGQVIAYYGLMFISWYLIGGNVHHMVSNMIARGELSGKLTKPLYPFAEKIFLEQGWKTLGLLTGTPVLIMILIGFGGQTEIAFDLSNLLWTIPSILMGAIIFLTKDIIIGCTTFWLQSDKGTQHMDVLMMTIFGGDLAPLALMPIWVQSLANVLPFRYIFALPIEIFLGQHTGIDLLMALGVQLLWLVAFVWLAGIIYRRGLIAYEAFGN